MRTASYIGFLVMVAVVVAAFAAFALFGQWWVSILLVVVAVAIGWYSLGLYARESTGSAYRLIRGMASDEDAAELAQLSDSARGQAIRQASDAPLGRNGASRLGSTHVVAEPSPETGSQRDKPVSMVRDP